MTMAHVQQSGQAQNGTCASSISGVPCDASGVQHKRIVPERLTLAMARAGYPDNAALARAVGVAPSQVTRWLSGKTTPGGDTLDRLCEKLGCSPAYLFGRIDEAGERARVASEASAYFGRGVGSLIPQLARLDERKLSLVRKYLDLLADTEAEAEEIDPPHDANSGEAPGQPG